MGSCACRQGGSVPPALPLPPGSLLVEPVFRAAPPSSSSSGAVLGAGASHFWASVRRRQNAPHRILRFKCRQDVGSGGLQGAHPGPAVDGMWGGVRWRLVCLTMLPVSWMEAPLLRGKPKERKKNTHLLKDKCFFSAPVLPSRWREQQPLSASHCASPRKKAELNLFDDLGKKDWGWPLSRWDLAAHVHSLCCVLCTL